MAIVDVTETEYIPNLSTPAANIQNLLIRAEYLAQSAQGCNRELEIKERMELYEGSYVYGRSCYSHTLYLRNWPVLETPAPVVSYRNKNYGYLSFTDWKEVDASQYSFDPETNIITVNYTAYQFKVNYTAGYDFSIGSTDPDVIRIKTIIGGIAKGLDLYESDEVITESPGELVTQYGAAIRKYRRP